MTEFKLTTPVAFIIFNRPDTTERVFAEIAKAKPTKLLVIADGAREDRVGEAEKVAVTRAIINRVDWDCEVLTNFSDVNLGCKVRVSSGIDWVFEQVKEAIILEDDCLPDPTFFRFCQEMLDRYRHDLRVGMISGDNLQFGRCQNDESYYFTKYVHIWGWATWRDRWQDSYDVNLKKWPLIRDQGRIMDIVTYPYQRNYWSSIFDRIYKNKIDTWDYQWVFANWVESRINVAPNINLVSNIGFDRVDATHTTASGDESNLPTFNMLFPLNHPSSILINGDNDEFEFKKLNKRSILKRIVSKSIAIIRKVNWLLQMKLSVRKN
ncbi:hemolytic protein HlpA [Candidatus Methylopumilus turicensis]|uniref:Hemolytic protein HlpA-like protein n=1 Tax=Candidatus Methylopumilus turicensis TaxID=1581680 RepID=A0A0B7IZQ7_9PROT|nr:hemolytic protein HlpA [Candidatus Methylopumilus turicensis]CEN55996.1 conserved protein of unknown function [Candidatus Methylopumilus turicensis]